MTAIFKPYLRHWRRYYVAGFNVTLSDGRYVMAFAQPIALDHSPGAVWRSHAGGSGYEVISVHRPRRICGCRDCYPAANGNETGQVARANGRYFASGVIWASCG